MNVKISEIALEIAKTSKEVLGFLRLCGLNVKSQQSSVSQEIAEITAQFFYKQISQEEAIDKITPPKKTKKESAAKEPKAKAVQKAPKDKDPKDKEIKEPAKKAKKIEPDKENKDKSESEKPKKPPKQEKLQIIKKPNEEPIRSAEPEESAKAEPEAAQKEILDPILEDLAKKVDQTIAAKLEISPEVETKAPFLRRTSIQIVKKNTPQNTDVKKAAQFSMQEILNNMRGEKIEKKPKKPPKQKPKAISHKANEKKIDLLQDRELHSFELEESDEIILFDLNEQINDKEPKEAPKEVLDRAKIQRKSTWINDGNIQRKRRKKPRFAQANKETKEKVEKITIPEEIRAYEFAEIANLKLSDVLKALFNLGLKATKNDFLDRDAIEILCEEFSLSYEIERVLDETEELALDPQNLTSRAPVVILMGHVDHGKTTLLDAFKNMKVAAHEAGGITQHIGAYSLTKNGKKISFIDTPGHAAFDKMRERGAKVTDIAIIVIAADDGVKAQTIEAFKHAKESNAQVIVAITKIDKENKNIDKLKSECSDLGFVPSDWGGDYDFVGVSAKSGEGLDLLLETILIQAEILDLKADVSAKAKAVVLEGAMDKGRGPVATIIMQQGTLKVGEPIVANTSFGRVRAIINDSGTPIKELYPSDVGVVVGFNEIPSAGSILNALDSDSEARDIAQKRANYLRQKELSKTTKVSFDELNEMIISGDLKMLPIIIKADTQGSLEAIRSSVLALSNQEVKIQIVTSGVGGISENDLNLAFASKSTGNVNNVSALILGFNIKPTGVVKTKSKELGIEIKTYSVIYNLIDDISALISGLMKPDLIEEDIGQAEVRNVFKIKNVGIIAGCFVNDGKILRNAKARIMRDGVVINHSSINSLKRFKDDAREVVKGYECGIMFENIDDIQVGDVIDCYQEIVKEYKKA